MLNKLFSWSSRLSPVDLSVLKTDVHSHLIPGIDDGAQTIEDSIELLKQFIELGYKKVITTPHIMSDYYRNTPEIIHRGLQELRKAINKHALKIEVQAAAEYYCDYEFEQLIAGKELLNFGDSYVLFELPFISEPPMLATMIFNMQMAGYKPVLAHPERYAYWYNDFSKYHELKEKGVILQLNINSLTGHYSPATKKIAERMISENLIEMVGSDCHHRHHMELTNAARSEKAFHQLIRSGNLLNATL